MCRLRHDHTKSGVHLFICKVGSSPEYTYAAGSNVGIAPPMHAPMRVSMNVGMRERMYVLRLHACIMCDASPRDVLSQCGFLSLARLYLEVGWYLPRKSALEANMPMVRRS